jgi:hypothetical protein
MWILVIESKRAELSLKVGIPQALSYMLAAPITNRRFARHNQENYGVCS